MFVLFWGFSTKGAHLKKNGICFVVTTTRGELAMRAFEQSSLGWDHWVNNGR